MNNELLKMKAINEKLIAQLRSEEMNEQSMGYVNALMFNNNQIDRIVKGEELNDLAEDRIFKKMYYEHYSDEFESRSM